MKKSFGNVNAFLFMLGLSVAMLACSNNANENTANADSANQSNNNTSANTATGQMAEATFSGLSSDTTVTGTARFTQMGDGKIKLTMDVTVPAKANQTVAVHIHQNGSCGNKGEAAGGHWNPVNENHGHLGEGAHHPGDIGNVKLDGSGKGTVELETDRWTIGGDEKTNILNKSMIVHSGVDDYASQPSGNSGSRIGCAIITARGQ